MATTGFEITTHVVEAFFITELDKKTNRWTRTIYLLHDIVNRPIVLDKSSLSGLILGFDHELNICFIEMNSGDIIFIDLELDKLINWLNQ